MKPDTAISETRVQQRAATLFQEAQNHIHRRTDRLFAKLMIVQWLAGIAAALWISPKTWIGATSQIHWHVWAAIFLGGTISGLPVLLAWKKPGQVLTRHVIAVGQMLTSALLVHLTGGRIETHFHIFGSLAFLAFYRDWRVLLTATVVMATDHLTRGLYWPQSAFGILTVSQWRWIEHTGWVIFEDSFLCISIRQSLHHMFADASQRASLETLNEEIESHAAERAGELSAAHKQLRASEHELSLAFENAAIGMAWVSLEGRWLKVNRAFHDLFGHTPEELYRKTYPDLTHPRDLDLDLDQIMDLLEGKINFYQVEKRYFHRQGHLVWAGLSVSLVRSSQGKPIHFILQIQDISDRKRAAAELDKTHKALLETSRRAGMAEVATGMLHNVGNVLNSVNVASSCVADSLRKSKAASLSKVALMLSEHQADLGTFFSSDPKGKQLPGYLAQLAGHLVDDQAAALQELAGLQKNIEHIKDIVSLQQKFAKVAGVTEAVKVTELVEDAVRMNSSSLNRHDIQIVREFHEAPDIDVEKHKVLQILVNLVRNAKQACDDAAPPEKRLTLRVTADEERVRISVTDNGCGIAPKNLASVFRHGFTTKKDGHGFGLHSGALAARELGGALVVQSDGAGRGATFTLELPFHPPNSTSH